METREEKYQEAFECLQRISARLKLFYFANQEDVAAAESLTRDCQEIYAKAHRLYTFVKEKFDKIQKNKMAGYLEPLTGGYEELGSGDLETKEYQEFRERSIKNNEPLASIKIETRVPQKWRFVDLETKEVWQWFGPGKSFSVASKDDLCRRLTGAEKMKRDIRG